jgi:hypothetical protein
MSLAFALMAAVNGSTGSSATLSYGLKGTKPRRRQPGGSKRFSLLRGGGASRQRHCPVNHRHTIKTCRGELWVAA